MAYQPRSIDDELDELLSVAPAIAIDGAKGVGKTRTATQRADSMWLLDDPAQAELLRAGPTFTDAAPGTLPIDEWQRMPQVGDVVRRQVDAGAPAGRGVGTGSAGPAACVPGTVRASAPGRAWMPALPRSPARPARPRVTSTQQSKPGVSRGSTNSPSDCGGGRLMPTSNGSSIAICPG